MLQSLFGNRRASMPYNTNKAGQPVIEQMSVSKLNQQLQEGQTPILVDVRSPEEYQFDGHIDGSRLLPLPMLLNRINELPKEQPIVCICRSGNRSQVACEKLAAQGFTNLANLSGGMMAWQRHGYPSK